MAVWSLQFAFKWEAKPRIFRFSWSFFRKCPHAYKPSTSQHAWKLWNTSGTLWCCPGVFHCCVSNSGNHFSPLEIFLRRERFILGKLCHRGFVLEASTHLEMNTRKRCLCRYSELRLANVIMLLVMSRFLRVVVNIIALLVCLPAKANVKYCTFDFKVSASQKKEK